MDLETFATIVRSQQSKTIGMRRAWIQEVAYEVQPACARCLKTHKSHGTTFPHSVPLDLMMEVLVKLIAKCSTLDASQKKG